MTTNVFDMNAGLMCGDSRWSVQHPSFIAYVDDTGFDKIIAIDGDLGKFAFVFAGDSELIQQWKSWIISKPSAQDQTPPVQNGLKSIAICIANIDNKSIVFENGQDIQTPEARFAGSGSLHAFNCWTVNKDAKKAIESAKTFDVYSGGEVKFLDFSSGVNNLKNSSNLKELHVFFAKEGMVMYKNASTNQSKILSIKEAAANDPAVQQLAIDLASGKISASAPCDAMHNTWSKEKVNELNTALKGIFK